MAHGKNVSYGRIAAAASVCIALIAGLIWWSASEAPSSSMLAQARGSSAARNEPDAPARQAETDTVRGTQADSVSETPAPDERADAGAKTPAASSQRDPTMTENHASHAEQDESLERERIRAPELEGGIEWLNCSGPLRLRDLRGKIVLLDFWTYCCINCMHVLPDLARLEKKYARQLVVIGVHSAKFDTEKDSKNIREAILRYHIEHPVVNDAHHRIWNAYRVRAWPTFWLIDPEGYLYGSISGEGVYQVLDHHIGRLVEIHRRKKTLNEEPLHFHLDKYRVRLSSPLLFPGKVLADARAQRLFIADSSHHRIVITDLQGKKLDILGAGTPGYRDGSFDDALFNDPQGLAVAGDFLYIADRKNHVIRRADLKKRQIETVAGTGRQSQNRRLGGPARQVPLNSPWDLWLHQRTLYIAMAGHHQIWRLDLDAELLAPYAGNGYEDIEDGSLAQSMFAQPSGLTSDGAWLYVADSESSAIRAIALPPRDEVRTLVGLGLFEFGDVDGTGDQVRLQHPLAVAWHAGKLYVADTYNNKIKLLDPVTRHCQTWLGDGQPGLQDDPPRFDEPAGLSVADGKLYIADTNNHAIRVADLKTRKVVTLQLQGVDAPKVAAATALEWPQAQEVTLERVPVSSAGVIVLDFELRLETGWKHNPLVPQRILAEARDAADQVVWQREILQQPPADRFTIRLHDAALAKASTLRIACIWYPCRDTAEGVCVMQSLIWRGPVTPSPEEAPTLSLTNSPTKK